MKEEKRKGSKVIEKKMVNRNEKGVDGKGEKRKIRINDKIPPVILLLSSFSPLHSSYSFASKCRIVGEAWQSG